MTANDDTAKRNERAEKEARLAEALRANLRRRKAQSAARRTPAESAIDNGEPPPTTPERTRTE